MQVPARTILVVLSNWSYPGQEGLHLQNAAVLQQVCRSGMRVHLLALTRSPAAVDTARLQAEWGPNLSVQVLPSRLNYPLLLLQSLVVPLWLNPNWRIFRSLMRQARPDLVHLEGIGLTPWLRGLRGQATLMSAVDAWSLRQTRLAGRASGLKRAFLKAYAAASLFAEKRYYPAARAVHVVSEDDAAYLRRTCRGAAVRVVPVGLLTLPEAAPAVAETSRRPPRIVFWGDLGVAYLRDGLLWLLRDVLPRLPASLRDQLVLTVLGRREPDPTLREAAGTGVVFRQWVDDVDEVLREASVVLLPDASGSGMKNRTLQSMACGVPVMGTSFAFEGVMACNDVECIVRDDAAEFAVALQHLLAHDAEARKIGAAGRQLVLRSYSMPAVVEAWRHLYLSCMAGTNGVGE